MGKSFSEMLNKDKGLTLADIPDDTPIVFPREKPNPFSTLRNTLAGSGIVKDSQQNPQSSDEAESCPILEPTTVSSVSKPGGFGLLFKKESPGVPSLPETKTDASIPEKIDASVSLTAAEFNMEGQPENFNEIQIADIKEKLDLLSSNIDNKTIVQNALKIILGQMKKHEFLKGILMPEDCGLMVRAMRESYGRTLTVKKERSATRQTNRDTVDSVLDELSEVDL